MGLFDGARDGTGSTADLSTRLRLPVVLVVDARGQGASVAALAEGFVNHRHDVAVAGVIPQPGSGRGARTAAPQCPRRAIHRGSRCRAAVGRAEPAVAPSRPRAGLRERRAVGGGRRGRSWRDRSIRRRWQPWHAPYRRDRQRRGAAIPPLGQRIAVARDEAFGFCYDALMEDWRNAGATVVPFSPLADEAPDAECRRRLPAGRLSRASCGPHRRRPALSRRAAGRGWARRSPLRRVRRLHGAGPGPDRRRRPPPRHGGAIAARDELSGAPARARLPAGAPHSGRPPWQGGDGLLRPRVPLLPRGGGGCRAAPVRDLRRNRRAARRRRHDRRPWSRAPSSTSSTRPERLERVRSRRTRDRPRPRPAAPEARSR